MSVKVYNKEEEILLSGILGIERIGLYMQDLSLSESQAVRFEDALKKRAKGEPLQHLTGKADFFGLKFFVGPGVFIPRPETEILVDAIIEKCRGVLQYAPTILDICTGSGCIAICLAKYAKCGKIIATDISDKAIQTARKNAILNGIDERIEDREKKIEFIKSDMFEGIKLSEKFDIIVCNPPYIKKADLKTLPVEVSYDPAIALDGGIDGLDFYRRIAAQAPEFLNKSGILAIELGDNQAEAVKGMFSGKTKIIRDLNGIERVLIWTK